MSEHLKRLDRLVYRAERAFVVFALLVMAFMVVLDVIHRVTSNDAAKVVDAVARVSGWFGASFEQGTPAYASLARITPWLLFTLLTGLAWFGIRTATRPRAMPHGRAVAFGAAGVVVVYGLVQLMLRLVPNGFGWSQSVALVLTLWVGFLGASMATYENKHLKVEALARAIPIGMRKWVACASAIATALVCFILMWLSIRYVRFNYGEYVATEGQGGLVIGADMPRYLAFMALPISFGIMMARFLGVAVSAAQGNLQESDPLAGLVDEAKRQQLASDSQPESDIPTEAVRPIVPEPVSTSSQRQRALERPEPRSGSIGGDAPAKKQSEVVTDRHESTDDAEPPAAEPEEK